MTATGHALIGTVIAAKVGNPALAIPIALASIFVRRASPLDTAHSRENQTKTRLLLLLLLMFS